jgi:predicted amidohydrolase
LPGPQPWPPPSPDYLKVEDDGRTVGSGDVRQRPVATIGDVCVGLLVCMDVDRVDLRRAVVAEMRASLAPLKVLCVPADMTGDRFQHDALAFPQEYEGVHVALSNQTKTYPQFRCRSFITDAHGKKIVVQQHTEPIYRELT